MWGWPSSWPTTRRRSGGREGAAVITASRRAAWLARVAGVVVAAGAAQGQERVIGIGFLPGGNWSWATAVSDEGSVVVGTAGGGPAENYLDRACRWTPQGGIQSL